MPAGGGVGGQGGRMPDGVATAAAPASAIPVLCVTRLAATTRSSRRPRSPDGVATPTGVIRIAAPLVVPDLPASSMLAPAATAPRACRVDGPSRSSEPRARIEASQATSSLASSAGSGVPPLLITRRASSTACSVSSVTVPAGSPAASGWPGGPGSKPFSRLPYRATMSARERDCVGMPSASPIASPYSAPSARERAPLPTSSMGHDGSAAPEPAACPIASARLTTSTSGL